MKKCDTDTQIVLESVKAPILVESVEGNVNDGEIPAHRFVGVTMIPGSAVRMAKGHADSSVDYRNPSIYQVDAAHLTNKATRGTMYDQVCMIPKT